MTQDLQKEVERLRELVKLMNLGSWRTVVLHNPTNSKRPSPESVTAFFPANPDMIRDLLHELLQTPPTHATEGLKNLVVSHDEAKKLRRQYTDKLNREREERALAQFTTPAKESEAVCRNCSNTGKDMFGDSCVCPKGQISLTPNPPEDEL